MVVPQKRRNSINHAKSNKKLKINVNEEEGCVPSSINSNNDINNYNNYTIPVYEFDRRMYVRDYNFRSRKEEENKAKISNVRAKKVETKKVNAINGGSVGEKNIRKEKEDRQKEEKQKGKLVDVNQKGGRSRPKKVPLTKVSEGSLQAQPANSNTSRKAISNQKKGNGKFLNCKEREGAFSHLSDNTSADDGIEKATRGDTVLLRDIYSHINKNSELFWSFKEGDEVFSGSRRLSSPPVSEEKEQRTVSQGYGETTFKSVSRLFLKLENLPEDLRIDKNSTFVDIGSGFGKVVFHARLFSKVKESTGIEFVRKRHDVAVEALHYFQTQCLLYAEEEVNLTRTKSGKSAPESTGSWKKNEDMRKLLLHGINFECADATKCRLRYTHIYMYDWIFNDDTYEKLAPLLEKSPFKVLVSYRNLNFLQKRGLKSIRQVGEVILNSTGKQSFKAHIFAKDPPTKRGGTKKPKN